MEQDYYAYWLTSHRHPWAFKFAKGDMRRLLEERYGTVNKDHSIHFPVLDLSLPNGDGQFCEYVETVVPLLNSILYDYPLSHSENGSQPLQVPGFAFLDVSIPSLERYVILQLQSRNLSQKMPIPHLQEGLRKVNNVLRLKGSMPLPSLTFTSDHAAPRDESLDRMQYNLFMTNLQISMNWIHAAPRPEVSSLSLEEITGLVQDGTGEELGEENIIDSLVLVVSAFGGGPQVLEYARILTTNLNVLLYPNLTDEDDKDFENTETENNIVPFPGLIPLEWDSDEQISRVIIVNVQEKSDPISRVELSKEIEVVNTKLSRYGLTKIPTPPSSPQVSVML